MAMAAVTPIRKKTVLIAEDHAASRKAIKARLEALNYEVVAETANGDEAFKLSVELKPSLIFMDVKMPKMSGIEAAKKISAISSIPIILLTGHASEDLADEAIEAGVFAILTKPITAKQFTPALKLALKRHEEFASLKHEVVDLKEAIEARKVIERAKGILMKRSNVSEEEAFKILQKQSQKENKKMHEIASIIISASKVL